MFARPRASPVCLLERAGPGIHGYEYGKYTIGHVDRFLHQQKKSAPSRRISEVTEAIFQPCGGQGYASLRLAVSCLPYPKLDNLGQCKRREPSVASEAQICPTVKCNTPDWETGVLRRGDQDGPQPHFHRHGVSALERLRHGENPCPKDSPEVRSDNIRYSGANQRLS